MKKLKAILAVLREKRGMYVFSLFAISLGTFFSYIAPLVVRTSIDSLLNSEPLDSGNIIDSIFIALGGAEFLRERLFIPAILLAALVMLQGIFTFVSQYCASRAAEQSIEKLRNDLFRHIQRQSFSYFANAKTGDIIQRCTSDMDTVRLFLQTQFVELGNTCVMIAIALGLMFSIHAPLALLTTPIIPITIGFSFVFFRKMEKAFTTADESEGVLSQMLSEHLRSVRVVKSFAREKYEIGRFDGLNNDFRVKTQRVIDLLAVYWSMETMISMFQILLVLSVGTIWAVQGSVSLGTLQVFIVYVWMILWPLRQMGRILVDMGQAFVGITRINEIRSEVPEDIHATGSREAIRGGIRFRNVSFRYPKADVQATTEDTAESKAENSTEGAAENSNTAENEVQRQILHSLNFSIEPGERLGILGPTGSGKTTILHLLAGLFSDYEGEIYLDNTELRELHLQKYRSHIGYVLQEPLLFSGSIKANIRMGREGANFHALRQSAQIAEIQESIEGFEQGYHTIVGERGITLSGGQKQRIAIARAIVRNAAIYIFDDSLSALDAETDARIRDNLANGGSANGGESASTAAKNGTANAGEGADTSAQAQQATTIIVSHRLSTVAGCDRIMILETGRISQIGSHEELIAQEGLYKRLWDLQKGVSLGEYEEEKNTRTDTEENYVRQ